MPSKPSKASIKRVNEFIQEMTDVAERTGVNDEEASTVLTMIVARSFVDSDYGIEDFFQFVGSIFITAAKQVGKEHLTLPITPQVEDTPQKKTKKKKTT
jgi:hypothetical protein